MDRRDFNRSLVGAAGATLYPLLAPNAQRAAHGARPSARRGPRIAGLQQPTVDAERPSPRARSRMTPLLVGGCGSP